MILIDQTLQEKSSLLNQIDADLIFVKLCGRKMISKTNKILNYNTSIRTP